MKEVMVAKNVSVELGGRTILQELSIDIEPGQIIGVIGRNGSGKTTLLNTLIGFHRPRSGVVLYRRPDGSLVSITKQKKLYKQTYGFAAQLPSFYQKLTVQENLEYYASMYGLSSEEAKNRIDELLALLQLADKKKVLSKHLSGGMQRRLDMACGLIHSPKLLFLDEPTADLDPALRESVWKAVQKIGSEGIAVILSTHHVSEIHDVCDRVAFLKKGKLSFMGDVNEALSSLNETHLVTFRGRNVDYEHLKLSIEGHLKGHISDCSAKTSRLVIRTSEVGTVTKWLVDNVADENIVSLQSEQVNLELLFEERRDLV